MSKFFAASFASLMGYGPKGSRAEDDEEKKGAKGRRAEEDDDAKGNRAEDDEKDRAEDEGDGDDEKKGKRAKGKAKGADDDGDDGGTDAKADDEEDDDAAEEDGDEKKDAKSKRAASAERKRCARIVAHGFKCGRPEQAAVFAFDTGMSSASAIAALNAAASFGGAAPKAAGMRERMSAEQPVERVAAKGASANANLAAQILAAGRLRRGEA